MPSPRWKTPRQIGRSLWLRARHRGRALGECILIGLVATPAGLAFARIGIPVPWLLGPLFAGLLMALATRRPWRVPRSVHTVAQALMGVAFGLRLPPDVFGIIGPRLPAMALLVLVTALLSIGNGFLLWRWARIDPATGFLGSIPGAAGSIVAVSGDLGADARLVAVLQYLRVLLVAFVAPFAVQHLAPLIAGSNSPVVPVPEPASFQAWHLVAIPILGLVGLGLGRVLHLPAGMFMGPFVVTTLGTLSGLRIAFPGWLFAGALASVGAAIGTQFDWALISRLGRVLVIQTSLVMLLMLAAAGLGYAFSLVTDVPLVTAFLGSTPGGMDAMIAVSIELGADPPFVMAMQMIRFFLLLVTGPWVARWLAGRFGGRRADAKNA